MKLSELAERLGGRPVEGDPGREVRTVASLEDGGPDAIGFVRHPRNLPALAASRIGAVIAPPGLDVGGRPALRSGSPNLDIARAARILSPAARSAPGVHARAVVDPSAAVDPEASIGAGSVIGPGARIGARTVLHANVTVYPDVAIGADCELHAGVVVREGTRVGERVILHPGVVLGADGFGFEFDEKGGLEKVPQVGVVVVEDDVEIGANTTVDRARFGTTRIGRGVKIDNLVQIGHNCEIGDGSAIVAQSGIAGSTVIGKRVFFMAQSGAANGLTIGDGSFIGARGGVIESLEPRSRVYGFPATAERNWHRTVTALHRLPEMLRRLRRIEKRLDPDEPGK